MSVDVAPEHDYRFRPVVCVIDDLHRSKSVADDAVAGYFTHVGVRLQLGTEPDWLTEGLVDDQEWRIEWVKLYEGLDLAAAFGETGNGAYLRIWERLIESFIDQVAAGHDTSDVSARRIQNWIYAAQRFSAGPHFAGFTPGFMCRFRDRIRIDLDHLGSHLTSERNHRTLELYALLIGGIAIADSELAQFGMSELATNAQTDVWSDGVHRECSSDYHLIVTRSLVGAIMNAQASGLDCPSALFERTRAALRFGMHLQSPDGTTPALSDGDRGEFSALLALGAAVFGDEHLAWVATRGARGVPPVERNVVFPVGGYVVQRSGWGSGADEYGDERHAILDCGPIGDGGHGHYDQLSVELYGLRRRLVVDPGRFTYADDETGLRQWFKGTAGHNTATVDDLDHIPFRRGKPKGPLSIATWLGSVEHDGVAMTRAEVRSPLYGAMHSRRLFMVDGKYWIVHDELRDCSVHDYAIRWHLDWPADCRSTITTAERTSTVRAPGTTIVIRGADEVTLEPGWVSEQYGQRRSAPVVVAAVRAASADVVTVVCPGEVDTPQLEVNAGSAGVRVVFSAASLSVDLAWERDVTGFVRDLGLSLDRRIR